ncbi:unnamed protein product, partial [Mesorhabditis spiculigera]
MSVVPDHYWKKLLVSATGLASEEQSTSDSLRTMSEKDREWLEKVMIELVDETDLGRSLERTMNGLKVLAVKAELSEEDHEKLEELSTKLEDLVQYADLTTYFLREHGLELAERFLNYTARPEVPSIYADVLATLSENNPQAQEAIATSGLQGRLLELLTNCNNEQLQSKLLRTISCAVRSNVVAFDAFVSNKGPSMLTRLVETSDAIKVAAKAGRILTAIAFTMVDYESRARALDGLISRNYVSLISKNQQDQIEGELAYIQDFLLPIDSGRLDERTRSELVAAFRKRLPAIDDFDEAQTLQALITRFSAPRGG